MRDVRNLLLAVDPGTRGNTGCALFDRVSLTYAAVAKRRADIPYCHYPNHARGLRAVIEVPRWYPKEHKIDMNDLLDLSLEAGRIAGLLERRDADEIEFVYPRTWKGTVPKAIHNKRVLAALTEKERALLPRRPRAKGVDHNLVDAVGIGLWKLGRM